MLLSQSTSSGLILVPVGGVVTYTDLASATHFAFLDHVRSSILIAPISDSLKVA
ncbi:MAG: hypothetical protein ACJ705_09365 [Nitrososphaeraceae archaeon]